MVLLVVKNGCEWSNNIWQKRSVINSSLHDWTKKNELKEISPALQCIMT